MKVRLVATDLDGTLVRRDGTISARTRRMLGAVEAAGVPLILVTGRPPRWMHPIVEQTGHRGIAICANGALRYDLHREVVSGARLLAPEPALAFARALRAAVPDAAFAVEEGTGAFGHEPAYRPRLPPTDATVGPLGELVTGPVAKLLARSEVLDADALLERAERAGAGLPVTLTHSSTEGLLEVAAAGVTKASALAELAAEHGVDRAGVLAFGDMPNDIPMLRWAGHGVAVAGAHPLVRAAADEITGDVDDDGVAAVLERWF